MALSLNVISIVAVLVTAKRQLSANRLAEEPLKFMRFDKEKYKMRHIVENMFARLKHFRAVATRYDKLKKSYEGTVLLVASMIWIKELAKFKECY